MTANSSRTVFDPACPACGSCEDSDSCVLGEACPVGIYLAG